MNYWNENQSTYQEYLFKILLEFLYSKNFKFFYFYEPIQIFASKITGFQAPHLL